MADLHRFDLRVDDLSLVVVLERSGDRWQYSSPEVHEPEVASALYTFDPPTGVLPYVEGQSSEDLRVAVARVVAPLWRDTVLLRALGFGCVRLELDAETDSNYRPSDGRAWWLSRKKLRAVAVRLVLVFGDRMDVELYKKPLVIARMGLYRPVRTVTVLTWDPDAQVWKGETGLSAVEAVVAELSKHLPG